MGGKTAIITGGSRGIGRAIAEELADMGYNLVLVAKDKKRLEKTSEEIRKKYKKNMEIFPCDLSDTKDIDSFIKFCATLEIVPDVLVNNAGTFIGGSTESATLESYDKLQALNMRGIFYLTQKLLPLIRKGKEKRIVIISTVRALDHYPGGDSGAIYAISKWGLRGWARSLREEVRKYKIGVTVIYPGAVFTDIWEGTQTPKEQFITPSDIAKGIRASLSVGSQTVIEEMTIMPLVGNITE
ncbi:MAG TPA: SDR family oxidoreductase [Candidatus Acidoferrum sp.]|nr:SDR family oxidoreductase [Candidatus Acidoferrum sp.]